MVFSELAAFGTGMAAFVRVVVCRLPESKPMYHDSFTPFWGCYYPFCRKEKQNPSPDNGQTMDFTITGSMWHRVVEVGIIAGCLFTPFFLPLIAVVDCLHTLPSAKRNP